MAHVPGSLCLEGIHVNPRSMDIIHDDLVPVFSRPRATEIDHRAAVRVAAARCAGAAIPRMRRGGGVMQMIRARLNIFEHEGIEMLSRLPLVMCTLDNVEEVRDDTGGDERLALVVEVDTPRVAGA